MIEGYAETGKVLLNPHFIIEVYAGGEGYGAWCNVKMQDGTVHRFKGDSASKIYKALQK